MRYFPEPETNSRSQIETELDLSDYATKSELKNAKGVDTSDFTNNPNLASLKSDFDFESIFKSNFESN